MSASFDIDRCIAHLNEVTGLHLAPDADHAVSFDYRNRSVLLRFLPDDQVCIAHIQLAELGSAALPDAPALLLEDNFMLSNTGGGALSWSRETRMVALNFFLPLAGADGDLFISRLNNMLAASDEWVERIHEINARALADAAERLSGLREGTAHHDPGHPLSPMHTFRA